MTLQDIFDHLSYGELSQLHIGGVTETGVTPENNNHLISHVNLGLTALHRRFFLKKKEQQVYVMPAVETYQVSAPDMFKIEQVFTSIRGEIPIGMGGSDSISLDALNVLRVPVDIRAEGEPLTVVYRANHGKISKRDALKNPEKVEIDLPVSHVEPLVYFIASRMHNPYGATSEEFHEGNNYAQKYEMLCRALENQGMQISESVEQTKFQRNGWV